MTEKEFLRQCEGQYSESISAAALRLAKEAGAKFDPEPVEVPTLWAPVSADHCGRVLVPASPDTPMRALTYIEALEVVRRSNLWPELNRRLRDLRKQPDDTVLRQTLASIILLMESRP